MDQQLSEKKEWKKPEIRVLSASLTEKDKFDGWDGWSGADIVIVS